jgi:hypothetical protein
MPTVQQTAAVEWLEQPTQVMPTVQQPAIVVRQLAAVMWLEQLTQVMPTVQQPTAAVRQLAALARLPMVTAAEMTTRIMLVTTPTTPTRILKTVLAEALKAETQEIVPMTTTARVAMGTVAMTTTVAAAQQVAMIENRIDTPMTTAGMIVEIATVTMMTMMVLVPLTMNST